MASRDEEVSPQFCLCVGPAVLELGAEGGRGDLDPTGWLMILCSLADAQTPRINFHIGRSWLQGLSDEEREKRRKKRRQAKMQKIFDVVRDGSSWCRLSCFAPGA